jgi:hypothetical protein
VPTESAVARQVIEALRKGIPPRKGFDLYTVGNEKLIAGVEAHLLASIQDGGVIRFISGSWGAGKTHFFRLLKETAFKNGCLVSGVELNVNESPLNKFERVFAAIVRNVDTPLCYETECDYGSAPFGGVLRETLGFLGCGERSIADQVTYEQFNAARERLMADRQVDIDFKKMVVAYWQTFLPENADPALQEQVREEALQWFSGEGTAAHFRKKYGINKIVTKENAKLMLGSLAGFVKLAGYRGLVILFDEAEQAFSVMRKAALKDAQNNLLSLINNIEELTGLLLVYATTPDFYTDPKHGIAQYGALAGRIGKPEDRPPRALNIVWNLDEVGTSLEDYQSAASKIRSVYTTAFPGETDGILPDDVELDRLVRDWYEMHPSLSAVRFWRVLVTAVVRHFDNRLDGEVRSSEEDYGDVIGALREL